MERVPFNELKVSTKTVVVYTNMELDIVKLFRDLPCYEIKKEDVPLTKKKKRPDIKKVRAPPRQLISIRNCYTLEHRGIITKPERSYIHELREKEMSGTITKEEMQKLKEINVEQKTLDFRHQLCTYMSLTKNENSPILNINIMIFKGCFKIVGCKKEKYVYTITKVLWEHIRNTQHYKMMYGETKPRFLFDFVMNNVSFKLGYNIQRTRLNSLMNQEKYKKQVKRSLFDPSGNTNINISFYSEVPDNFRYLVYEFDENNKITELYLKENLYKKKKKENKPYVTILVFRSSKAIVTCKYEQEMARVYYFFLDVVTENRKDIEEVLAPA